MKICENGVCREMTPEEIVELQAIQADYHTSEPTIEERISALEDELVLSKILLGVDV